jgi:hypothetical protein
VLECRGARGRLGREILATALGTLGFFHSARFLGGNPLVSPLIKDFLRNLRAEVLGHEDDPALNVADGC